MKNILIIDTGGTFNKIIPKTGRKTIVDDSAIALKKIALHWRCNFELITMISKDSLDMTQHDRLELLMAINSNDYNFVVIVHGTDTMDITAEYLAQAEIEKSVILTGSMVPFNTDPIEATANFASAYGYINALSDENEGVYIAMNGIIEPYKNIVKDHGKAKFVFQK